MDDIDYDPTDKCVEYVKEKRFTTDTHEAETILNAMDNVELSTLIINVLQWTPAPTEDC